MKNFLLTLLFLFTLGFSSFSQELPEASFNNSFYILPLFEHIRVPGYFNDAERKYEVLKMKEQLGEGNLYHRLGFSFIYSPYDDFEVRKYCDLAIEHGLHAGLIFALQSHTRNDYRAVADQDLRLYQWRKDGIDWKGAYTSTGEIEVPEDERDYKIPTNSRYAATLREYNFSEVERWAESVKKLMEDYPGVVVAINGPIEEELAIGGHISLNKLADYSPFAITEFRDWLRHSGIYDASSGKYAGEGASHHIIGELIDFNGTMRSQFYDDPTPGESNGTGVSFNEHFGTIFQTWTLKYWDLDMYPEPITDESFDCTPEEGVGFCPDGFDAPRNFNKYSSFWKAWSYDIPDQGGAYPPGNPEAPAFGFRQNLVRNFVRDLFDIIISEGFPEEIMYAHQIPGEALGNFTGAEGRNRSSASTIWTGYLEKFNTVGITRFGAINPDLMTQYASDWGIFEWHTLPNSYPNSDALYTTSLNDLNKYYDNNCHMLFPGWWQVKIPVVEDIFPLNDSKFATAINDFMRSRTELPYHQQIGSADFIPPVVNGLDGEIHMDSMVTIEWDSKIWSDLVATWDEWSQVSHFELETSKDGENWLMADSTTEYFFHKEWLNSTIFARVRAGSTSGKWGEWSEAIEIEMDTTALSLIIEAEFDTLFADPAVTNSIKIRLESGDHILDPDLLAITVSGSGSNLNTVPVEADLIEKFWPMNSPDEVGGVYKIDGLVVKGGVLFGKVSPDEPIDPYFTLSSSNLNTEELPYISFRIFSSLSTTGQLYWFFDGGFSSTTYSLEKGWNTVFIDAIADWVSHKEINSVRLDPGTTANSEIMLDWFAISSNKLSGDVKNTFGIQNGEASFVTVPFIDGGDYKVVVSYGELTDSITINTKTINSPPAVLFQQPTVDTFMELGEVIEIGAQGSDNDGIITQMDLLTGDSVMYTTALSELRIQWKPDTAGIYELSVRAIDNGSDTVKSNSILIEVFQQETYSGEFHPVPGTVEAENYDLGGEMIAYHDQDDENQGNVYRDDGVDIEEFADQAGNYYVGHTEVGEWLEYSIEVPEDMKVDILLNARMVSGMGEFHFEIDNKALTNRIIIPQSDDFQHVGTRDIFLPEGIHKLRLVIDDGGFDIDYIAILEYEITGIGRERSIRDLMVYPNPASQTITVNMSDMKYDRLEIYSLSGILVKSVNVQKMKEAKLSISDISPGMYFIRLIGEKENASVSFLKSK